MRCQNSYLELQYMKCPSFVDQGFEKEIYSKQVELLLAL